MIQLIRSKIFVLKDDITQLNVDAIVNAANSTLLGGGGVDGAIHDAAGPELLEECEKLDGCPTGEAKITKAYNIDQVKAIIHTVGPRIGLSGVDEEKSILLQNCYENSLNIAKQHNLKSIAFPCISTGIYNYPKDEACKTALETVTKWLMGNGSAIEKVVFCVFNEMDERLYNERIEQIIEDDECARQDEDNSEPVTENKDNNSV